MHLIFDGDSDVEFCNVSKCAALGYFVANKKCVLLEKHYLLSPD
jgi:hypothetical protein